MMAWVTLQRTVEESIISLKTNLCYLWIIQEIGEQHTNVLAVCHFRQHFCTKMCDECYE